MVGSAILRIFNWIFFGVLSFALQPALAGDRLDPHGPTKSESCTACHREGQRPLRDFQSACSSCHNSIPHSGIAEHMGKKFRNLKTAERGRVDCLSCHSAHRKGTPGTKVTPVTCADCHSLTSKKWNHKRHLDVFAKGVGECTSCHSFSVHSEGFDPLAKNVVGHPIRGSRETCTQCHGVGAKFKHQWTAEGDSKSCLSCHQVRLLQHRKTDIAAARGAPEEISCRTCHFSGKEKADVVKTCASCHGGKAEVLFGKMHVKTRHRGIKAN